MGDRANIVIKCDGEQVCLYTHWDGSELKDILKSAMKSGESRWRDFQYLNRIIFCQMVKGDVDGETGYGISQNIHDGGGNVIVVDVDKQKIIDNDESEHSFAEYVS